MGGSGLLTEFARVEHLGIRHVHKWINRVHQQRLLEQKRLPDVLTVVVVVPEDTEVVERRKQT